MIRTNTHALALGARIDRQIEFVPASVISWPTMTKTLPESATGRGDISRRSATRILCAILAVAAVLRLVELTAVPPGLNQDEAANAWNAWSLLKTGVDQHGAAWPVFSFREIGSYRSTLYMYLVMPFQVLYGPGSLAVRLPNALGGIALVALTYFVASRLTTRTIGVVAAGLLAIQPWNLYMSRWGNEGGFTGLLAIAPLAGLIWANLPPASPDSQREPRPLLALFAGLLTGLACYGYPAARLFIPIFLMALAVLQFGPWLQVLRSRRGRLAALGFVIGFAALFGPLVWMHVFHGETMNVRGRQVRAWAESDPWPKALEIAAVRYAYHFQPSFLFQTGDEYYEIWPVGWGVLTRATLPLMALGMFWLMRRRGLRHAGVVLLAWLILYPAGDIVSWHYQSAHAMRSAPGMALAAILAAVGLVETWKALESSRVHILRMTVACFVGAFLLGQSAAFAWHMYVKRPKEGQTVTSFHVDLVDACRWLGPRLGDFDGVYFTIAEFNLPYIVAACALPLDPQRWQIEPREYKVENYWLLYSRVGKLHFLYERTPAEQLAQLKADGPAGKYVFVVRPSELPDVAPQKIIYSAHEARLHIVIVDVPVGT
jgi:4-amino-4-deoxy-L-arabinose transferase-like glycosyltransferase